MPQLSDVETADRLSRKRAKMLPILAVMFVSQQASFFAARPEDGARAVDQVKIAAWLVLSIVLLLMLTTDGAWLRRRQVRTLLNDDVTRANRVEALRVGFTATMIGAVAMYVTTLFGPVSARATVHILMTIGIAAALLRFGQLERRAHRDG